MSIIITITSNNITVFVSNNVIFFGCFMSMGYGTNNKTPTIVPNTIISNNITALVSHNVICFGCFMSMSHGAHKKAATIVPPPPDHVFIRLVCCLARKTLSVLFCSDLTDHCIKIMHF